MGGFDRKLLRGNEMFFRIIAAPPGYAPEERYMVAAYDSLDFNSLKYTLSTTSGSKFAATLEEARRMIPGSARRLSLERDCQFLELWEGCENRFVPTDQPTGSTSRCEPAHSSAPH